MVIQMKVQRLWIKLLKVFVKEPMVQRKQPNEINGTKALQSGLTSLG